MKTRLIVNRLLTRFIIWLGGLMVKEVLWLLGLSSMNNH